MINEKDLDTIIDAVTWSYEECDDKVPQNILDTLNEIKTRYPILYDTIKYLEEYQQTLSNPTLDECIKEWNEKFNCSIGNNYDSFEIIGREFAVSINKKKH